MLPYQPPPWLEDYGSSGYRWQPLGADQAWSTGSRKAFHRPLGYVESSFDSDGRYWEGRADLFTPVRLNIRSSLDKKSLRERLILAWAYLKCTHWLLRAQAQPLTEGSRPHFVVQVPRSLEDAISESQDSIVFLEDVYEFVDPEDFGRHVVNTGRIVDPRKSLTRLFVLPIPAGQDRFQLKLIIIGAHMIWDGLSNSVAIRDLVAILNLPVDTLHERIESSIQSDNIIDQLPLPQEALYPLISGSPARKRWFWVLTRILRHVRKPLIAAFPNPLLRTSAHERITLSPTYAAVLDYSRPPPLTTANVMARTSLLATQRLHRLCRQVDVSIGAGSFALAALIQMEMYEQQYPRVPASERRPFISGFPLNPRAFFNHHDEPNSLMLAFCDGILLPFLPSHVPLEGRLRLLMRQAHRQLSAFQKRRAHQPVETMNRAEALRFMGSRGPGRVLANQYLSSIERAENMLPQSLRRKDVMRSNPQSAYPARLNATPSTCNISSVGNVEIFRRSGIYDLEDTSKDLVADLIGSQGFVRARDDEFLVGVGGDARGLWANISLDGTAMDPVLVAQWKTRFETILDEDTHQDNREVAKL